jgi:hypothetical protein
VPDGAFWHSRVHVPTGRHTTAICPCRHPIPLICRERRITPRRVAPIYVRVIWSSRWYISGIYKEGLSFRFISEQITTAGHLD